MRKLLSMAAAVFMAAQICLFPAYAKPDWPKDTGAVAQGAIVIDADSGAMIFGQNVRLEFYPASITKLLTALVVVENAALDEVVTYSYDAIYNVEEGSGNALGLAEGDQLTVEDCLYVLLLNSSNQTANALAEHVAGSREAFVDMMNAKIAEIGCTGSHFKNPSGLNDPEQVVTPYDMAVIARAAFANPTVLEVASSKRHSLPPTINSPEGSAATNHHRIIVTTDTASPYYLEGNLAGKTGYTSKAGNTLVTYAERDGRKVISVILKGTQPQYYLDSISLMNFAFSRFKNVSIAENETALTSGEAPMVIGGKSYIPADLMIDERAVLTLPNEAEFSDAEREIIEELPEGAPDHAVALLCYTYNDRKIGEAYLIDRDGIVTAALPPETEPETEAEIEPETVQETEEAEIPAATASEPKSPDGGGFPMGILIALAAAAAAVVGGVFFVAHRREEEARQAALRRQRRRRRLAEEGCEEEFERLMQERMKKRKE